MFVNVEASSSPLLVQVEWLTVVSLDTMDIFFFERDTMSLVILEGDFLFKHSMKVEL